MPAGSVAFPAFSLSSRGLLAKCWKVHTTPYRSNLNAPFPKILYSQYSSIADAMLGRATKEHAALKPKGDLAKQLFPSSSPASDGNIRDAFKNSRPSSQSIVGYTSYKSSSNALRARSPNIKQGMKRSSTASTSRTSSGLSSIFSKEGAFKNTTDPIDLTQDGPVSSIGIPSTNYGFDLNDMDFEDDADIDLSMDYELPMSMPAPPKPVSQKQVPSTSPSTPSQVQRPHPNPIPTSSAPTWPSSSPSHKITPPGARLRRQREALANHDEIEDEPADANPRPAKRRALPWAQKKAELDQIASSKEDEKEAVGSESVLCFKCKKPGHYIKDCKAKSSVYALTPLPADKKDKQMPWNTTGSAVREEKKKFKDKHQARKLDETQLETLERRNTAAMAAAMTPITLSQEQQRVLDLVVNQQKSVFFTGSAGTGKSVLMRAIIAELKKKYSRDGDRVAVTASTGLAACNIGGVTLHSFGGIGLGKEDVPTLVRKIKRNPKAKTRWIKTKILVIDEISMVDGDLFDKLEGIARALRNNGRPFGGIQLVITGDFFQLPPVPDYDNKSRGVKFAFDAGTWSTAINHTIGLTEVFRQKDPGESSSLAWRNKANACFQYSRICSMRCV